MKTTLRTVITVGLLVGTLVLAGCHDGLYAGSFGYGYSGTAHIRPGAYYQPSYGHTYGRYGYYGSGHVSYGGHGNHHRGHGHHSPSSY